ncbi:MAG: hypothetical protein ACREK3_01180 [Gemmatimonadota bacterium]
MPLKAFGRVSMMVALAFVGGLLGPRSLNAQARHEIQPGTSVRLTVPETTRSGLGRIEGRLVRLDADSVVIADEKQAHAVALVQVLRIEIRTRRGRGWGALRGLGWGASIGAIAGALIGGINPDDDPGGSARFGAVFLGAFGGGIGAAIGAAWPGERWVELPVSDPGWSGDESKP